MTRSPRVGDRLVQHTERHKTGASAPSFTELKRGSMTMIRKLTHSRWLLLGVLPLASLAHAQVSAQRPDAISDSTTSPHYAVQITPYAWITGLLGESSPFKRAPSLDIEKSFSDVLHDLRAAAFLTAWVRRDRYVFNSDLLYVNTRESEVVG